VIGAKGRTRCYQSWCDGLEAPKDWLACTRSTGCTLQARHRRGTQLGASKEQEVVQAENKTQCKRSKAENCECGALKYRIPCKEYYNELMNAEQRPSGAKLTSTIKLPGQVKLPGRERLSSRVKMDKRSCLADQSCQGEQKCQRERRCRANQGRAERGGPVERSEVAEIGQR